MRLFMINIISLLLLCVCSYDIYEHKSSLSDSNIPVKGMKVRVAEAKLVQGRQYGSYGATKYIGGNLGGSLGSTAESGNLPVIIEYTMDSGERVDYILLLLNTMRYRIKSVNVVI